MQIRNKFRQLRETLEAAASKHSKCKAKYQQTAEAIEKQHRLAEAKLEASSNPKSFVKVRCKLLEGIRQLFLLTSPLRQ